VRADTLTVLSVCCMTGGRAPERLAAILELLRPIAGEIVIAVDDRHDEASTLLARHADRVATFPSADPSDRPLAWLFGLCRGDWILNIDDDEVPGAELLAALPSLVERTDITHCWIARQWVYPSTATHLDQDPWTGDYQIRLVQTDPRFLHFSDEFHRPVACYGPGRFVGAPLWHLDLIVNSPERRREKAIAYERARRGMRVAGVSHNSGLYLPELRPQAATAVVPQADRVMLDAVLAGRTVAAHEPVAIERSTHFEIDAVWPGEPFSASLGLARVRLDLERTTMVAGVQQTLPVHVTNEGEATWGWGEDAYPALRLSYRWDEDAGDGLRTPLPAALTPGETMLVPLHVLPPNEPGRHMLELDVVHEHVRWLGVGARVEVTVRSRRRIALAGDPAVVERLLDALFDVPELEPILLQPDEDTPAERFGHPRVPGLRSYLFGPSPGRVKPALVVRTGRLLQTAAGRGTLRGSPERYLSAIAGAACLVLAGVDWEEDAPQTRELWRLASTVAAARMAGVPVLRVGPAPRSVGAADRALAATIGSLVTPVAESELLAGIEPYV